MSFQFKDLFISYGRRESLGFVGHLHQRLKLAGYDGWFDKVNIPDGDDYAQRINYGIESAHNFIYVMAPRCMTSPYCLIELEYARLLGKRVIPINQMVIFETQSRELSAGDQQVLVDFYQFYNLPDPNIRTTRDVLDRSHGLIGKTDWLAAQNKMSEPDCQDLAEWSQPYENLWAKHDDLDYLQSFYFPVFGETIDALDGVVERITAVLERQTDYVHTHTKMLVHALHWQKNQLACQHLLVGKERTAAEEWLLTEFLPPKQPPCQPCALVCEYICEARKNAEHLMTDIFICYGVPDKEIRDSVIQSLSRYAKTIWTHDRDIQKGADYGRAIEAGIENADNLFYFISPGSVASEYCQRELEHALQYNKRIVPLLIAPTPASDVPEVLRGLQYVDFTDNTCQADYDSDIDDILNILRHDQEYYEQHKVLLARALKWEAENRKPSFLLRGHNLENAQTWLRLNDQRELHPPLVLHKELITASEAAKGQLGTEVFVSYSRKDGDFARQLNTALQKTGKTTWFDQESISTGVDFEKEIFKGIDSADNFLFVLSPDAVQSEYCEREVNYAATQSKRVITVLHRETDPITMPEALRVINWIDFKDTAFDKSFPKLVQTIELDREHAHQHTVLQQRASDWAGNNRSGDFLLNLTACANAESWLDTAQDKQPAPTLLQQDFIQDSRGAIDAAERAERKRRNLILASVTGGMIIATLLAGFAFFEMKKAETAKAEAIEAQTEAEKSEKNAKEQAEIAENAKAEAMVLKNKAIASEQEAIEARTEAEKHANISLSRQLGAQAFIANQFPNISNGSGDLAPLLAVQAFKIDKTTGKDALLRVIQNSRLKTHYYGHTDSVQSVAFSPDGKFLVSGGSDKTVRLWDIETQTQIGDHFSGHTDWVQSVAFSPDGKLLASASNDETVRLWDIETQTQIGEPFSGHTERVFSVAFSPDGKFLASGSDDRTVRLWNIETRTQIGEFFSGPTDVWSVAFSPKGKFLASANGDNTVRLWDIETHTQIGQPFSEHTGMVYSIAYSPKGKFLASASGDKTVRLWDIAKPAQVIQPFSGHTDLVWSVAFSPDGKFLASGGSDKTVRLWDIETQAQIGRPFLGHLYTVRSVTFSPDGKFLASASDDKTIRLWNIEKQVQVSQSVSTHPDYVNNIAFSPDGKFFTSVSYDNTVTLWDSETHTQVGDPFSGHTDNVQETAFSQNGKLLALSNWDQIQLWDIETQTQIGESVSGNAVALSHEGKFLASVSDDHTIRLWNIEKQVQVGDPFSGHDDRIHSLAFSPNGQSLASASLDKTVRLWDVETQTQIGDSFSGHTGDVNSVAFSPNGKFLALAAGYGDQTVRLWDIETHTQVGYPFSGHTGDVNSVAFSPDGKFLASAGGYGDNTVRLWDIKTHTQIGESFSGHTSTVLSVAFSPDGKLLASTSLDKTVRLWDMDPESWQKKACRIANRHFSQDEWRKYMGERPYEETCPIVVQK